MNQHSIENIQVLCGSDGSLERFKVGARVECSVKESFLEGTVVRHHYRESDWEPDVFAPYQVKLDGQSPGLIYARWDEDDCIRAAGADSDAGTV